MVWLRLFLVLVAFRIRALVFLDIVEKNSDHDPADQKEPVHVDELQGHNQGEDHRLGDDALVLLCFEV